MNVSMLRDGLIARSSALLVAAVLMGACSREAVNPNATPIPRALQLCDYICLAVIDTPSGTIAMGTGWDEGAKLDEGYAAAWVVRGGTSTRTVLSRGDVFLYFLVPWGDGAVIIGGDTYAANGYLVWITRDGASWEGPTPISLPEGFSIARFATTWRWQIVILGERLIDDRYFVSVWTSSDALTWKRAPSPPEFDDAGFTRSWEGGDGFVVGITAGESAGQTMEWPWTSADLAHWRPLSSPYPCYWEMVKGGHQECRPLG